MQVSLQAVATSLFAPWQRCNWWISQPVTYNYIFSLLMLFQFRLVQNRLQKDWLFCSLYFLPRNNFEL